MPHFFDFSECIGDINTIEVNPKGWVSPLFVEYGLAQHTKYDTQISIVWRVKGTRHTFAIYERRINVFSNGNYKKHFEEALQNFREDYLSWFKLPEYKEVEWKYEYQSEFGKFILPDESGDNKGND